MPTMKVLLSSLSSKIALFKKVEEGAKRVNPNATTVGADSDPNCIGARELDDKRFLPMKRLENFSNEELLQFLDKNNITHLIPTRDGELEYWAQRKDLLDQKNIKVMISKSDAIQFCGDKLLFSSKTDKFAIKNIPTASTIEKIGCEKIVVKERFGSGSSSIGVGLKPEQARNHAAKLTSPIFQPYVDGKEISAETWIDQKGRAHGILLRWREKVVNGESHESITFKNDLWANQIKSVFQAIPGLHGHCLAQVIVAECGTLNLVEINPRLGGASPLALSSGMHSIDWFLLESMNKSDQIPNEPSLNEGRKLVKQNGIVIIS